MAKWILEMMDSTVRVDCEEWWGCSIKKRECAISFCHECLVCNCFYLKVTYVMGSRD